MVCKLDIAAQGLLKIETKQEPLVPSDNTSVTKNVWIEVLVEWSYS